MDLGRSAMAIQKLQISGYRSIRDVHLTLKPVNVLLGENGTGKSNLYRALYLIWAAAEGSLPRALADEGGLPSALWAGARRKTEKALIKLKLDLDELSYSLVLGRVPLSDRTGSGFMEFFKNDPDIKAEVVSVDYRGKKISLLNRKRGAISARNMDGRPIDYPLAVTECESVLSGLREPHLFPDLSALRSEILSWRFYHNFRTDSSSPLRQAQIPVFTPILNHEGTDLAAALATICAIDGTEDLFAALDDAFPGARLAFDKIDDRLDVGLRMPEFNRPFWSSELSDGTLQYLCLLAALLTPRPPGLMALNEPETSIHVDLMEPLARLITKASKRSQLWITTHSTDLARFIKKSGGISPIELEKVEGETRIVGAKLVEDDDDDDYDDENRNDE
jgi:predicted ATPase